jgi:hypothetical protein
VKAITVGLVIGAIAFAGCGGSDSERVAKVERRVAKLEAENARLEKEVDATRRAYFEFVLESTEKIGKLDRRTRANDEALYRGVAAAQYDIYCGPNPQPGCHVPLGLPGSVYKSGERGRIFATPYP